MRIPSKDPPAGSSNHGSVISTNGSVGEGSEGEGGVRKKKEWMLKECLDEKIRKMRMTVQNVKKKAASKLQHANKGNGNCDCDKKPPQ